MGGIWRAVDDLIELKKKSLWLLCEPEAQAGLKIAGRNTNNLRLTDDTTLMAESEEELKSLVMKVKEELKSWFKTQHSKN